MAEIQGFGKEEPKEEPKKHFVHVKVVKRVPEGELEDTGYEESIGAMTRVAKSIEDVQTALDTTSEEDSNPEAPWISPTYPPDQLKNLLDLNITHMRCVLAKAADTAGVEYKILPEDPEVDSEVSKEERKTLRDFAKKNKLLELIEESALDYESIGWCCWEVIRNKGGNVSRLKRIPADSMRVVKKNFRGIRAKFVQVVSETEEKYVYFQEFPEKYPPDGKPTFISKNDGKTATKGSSKNTANEVVWIHKKRTAGDERYGQIDVIPAIRDMSANSEIEQYLLKFFRNGCIPRHAVTIKGAEIDDDYEKLIEDFFRTEFKQDPGKTLILASDDPDFEAQFVGVEVTQKEADYKDTRKDIRDFILLAHGMPPAIIGIIEQATLGSGNGYSQAETYVNRIVLPSQRVFQHALDSVTDVGLGIPNAVIRLSPPDIRDMLLEMRRHTGYVSGGVMSVNEARRELGLEPREGGDDLRVWSRRTKPETVGESEGGVDKPGKLGETGAGEPPANSSGGPPNPERDRDGSEV